MRCERFDVAVSGRSDPRDQFLLWLAGVRGGSAFARPLASAFLNEICLPTPTARHRVEDWWLAQQQVSRRR